ncbi:MAG: hypothetical protein Nk1A_7110 [Endomicrobiia bacterium]|nr:MAG: hypothetical protein Nk1A_7110 [Endomicrobiia bacterium]
MMNKTKKLDKVIRPSGKPSISHIQKEQELTLFNTPASNALVGKKKFIYYDEATKTGEYEINDGKCYIEDVSHVKFAKDFPLKYFTVIANEFTKINPRGSELYKTEINIKIRQLQEDLGFKSYSTTKRLSTKWNKILFSLWVCHQKVITFLDKKKKKELSLNTKTRILESISEIKQGVFSVKFTETFAKYFGAGHLTTIPKAIICKRSNVAMEIFYKLCIYARINENKKKTCNANGKYILSVKSILESVQSIPSYSEIIKSSDRHPGIRIIKPFEAGLEELKNEWFLEWEYCNSKGIAMTDNQLKTEGQELRRWGVFKDLYIKYRLLKHEDKSETIKLSTKN